MKVLFWLKRFPATSETFIRDQVVHVINAGIDVEVFAKTTKQDTTALKGFEKYKLQEKLITLDGIWCRNKWKRLFQFLWLSPKLIFSKHAAVYRKSLQVSKYGKQSANLIHFFTAHFLLKHQFDIIHTHYGTMGNEIALYKEMGVPVKLFVTFHGFDIRLGIENKEVYTSLLKYADRIISISSFNKKSLLDIGFKKEKLIDLPNSVDTSFFISEEKEREPTSLIKIISVGRLTEIKGYPIAIQALALFRKRNPHINFQYTIVGEGNLRDQLQQQIDELNLREVVQLNGKLSSHNVVELLKQSNVFFLASFHEALPTVILEAMSCELPILATNVGAVKKMVDGAGIIVVPNNVDAFLKGWEILLESKSQWKKLGEKGRAIVKEKYDSELITQQLLNNYKESIQ